jgi:hypothetical protein
VFASATSTDGQDPIETFAVETLRTEVARPKL